MDKKKEVKYFISEFDRINEGLLNKNFKRKRRVVFFNYNIYI